MRHLKQELEHFTSSGGRKAGNFSFSLALKHVRQNIDDVEREKYEERIRNGGVHTSENRLCSNEEKHLKTLNQFLLKYKEKFQFKG